MMLTDTKYKNACKRERAAYADHLTNLVTWHKEAETDMSHLPDEARNRAWEHYVSSARRLVAVEVFGQLYGWTVDEWRYDEYSREFQFVAEASVELYEHDEMHADRSMRVRVSCTFDPKLDLDVELARLKAEMAFYVGCTRQMTRESHRSVIAKIKESLTRTEVIPPVIDTKPVTRQPTSPPDRRRKP